MQTLSLLAVLAAGALAQETGKLGDAMAIMNNPPGATYKAMFTEMTGGMVRGSVTAMSTMGGMGVMFDVMLKGLPMEGGPYGFHLHDQPVPNPGNCTATLAHLDPYQRGQATPCNMSMPQTCEVGDLSGKHGKLNMTEVNKTFTDQYAALVPGIGAFFGNRSIVIHWANSTRLACANFAMEMMPPPMSTMMPPPPMSTMKPMPPPMSSMKPMPPMPPKPDCDKPKHGKWRHGGKHGGD